MTKHLEHTTTILGRRCMPTIHSGGSWFPAVEVFENVSDICLTVHEPESSATIVLSLEHATRLAEQILALVKLVEADE